MHRKPRCVDTPDTSCPASASTRAGVGACDVCTLVEGRNRALIAHSANGVAGIRDLGKAGFGRRQLSRSIP
jgi:hypothetical protein